MALISRIQTDFPTQKKVSILKQLANKPVSQMRMGTETERGYSLQQKLKN